MARRPEFGIGGHTVAAGERRTIELPVSVLSDHTPVTMSVHVVHGRRAGPTLFVSASVHGDEVIGVEIVRRLLRTRDLKSVRGTLLVVPIVNTYGFLNHSRYLPDRRDLNRCFPGSDSGSLAARLADVFTTEIVARSDVGIDLHSAAVHRTNLPQIRISPDNPKMLDLARAFGAPVILTSPVRDGSLRGSAAELGVDVLLYEAGEGLRFDELAVRVGVSGILRTMRHLEMLPAKRGAAARARSLRCDRSRWVRAPVGGLLRAFRREGDIVAAGTVLGAVSDPFGEKDLPIKAVMDGIIIGRAMMPIVNEGDAVFHIAAVRASDDAEATVDDLAAQMRADPLFDEDEII
ncbi:succinylglutamate desuccinylase [Rhodobacteraceae bacterium 2CG4]|uniref:Succinylglutamate desuccinylase n=1 Tax=Halovulum marinum TaxID=2662447 RepID=A0A6L5Z2N3_9RHOB|nr:succinylglutamate desuccinylase/aspartoacylase family protein [Halovulum marinum]MSU90787.1 succinylglutamate desuccinylase [Halovulum marinum]